MKILNFLKKITSKTVKDISKSSKSLDRLLENEPIVNGIENFKERTGDLVQKTGEIYESAHQKVDDLLQEDILKEVADKTFETISLADDYSEELKEKGKELLSQTKIGKKIDETLGNFFPDAKEESTEEE